MVGLNRVAFDNFCIVNDIMYQISYEATYDMTRHSRMNYLHP